MPNVATLLKDEIARIARRTLKTELDALRKSSAGYRREIAALKPQVAALERSRKGVERRLSKGAAPEAGNAEEGEGGAQRALLGQRPEDLAPAPGVVRG